ncbi:MAG: hypothetical protein MJ237_06010 [bacterium]|nr:hypothetical protein [bacterium]
MRVSRNKEYSAEAWSYSEQLVAHVRNTRGFNNLHEIISTAYAKSNGTACMVMVVDEQESVLYHYHVWVNKDNVVCYRYLGY